MLPTHRFARFERQAQQHDGAPSECRADAQRAAVKLGQRFRYGETEARTLVGFGERAFHLLEWPAERLEGMFRNADAIILEREGDGVGMDARPNPDPTAFRGEFYGIRQQVDADLLEGALVGPQLDARGNVGDHL